MKDENLNFLYDQEAELFGWFPEAVDAGDQLSELPTIMMFPREKRSILKDALHTEQGWLKLVIEGPLPKPVPMLVPAIDSSISMWRGDTLHIWYPRQRNYSGQVIVNDDTTRIREAAKTPMTSQLTIRPTTGRIGPGGEVIFQVSVPAIYYDTSKIVVAHDTIGTLPYIFREDTVDLRRFMIRAPWEETTRYKITFLPGAITDFWGRSHDTIHHSVAVTAANQFGDLMMTIDNLDSTKTYLLLLKEGEQIIDTFVVENTSDIQVTKQGLLPAAYIIGIIEDLNRNGLCDTGDYDKQRQPERKMIFMPEKLRADWDQEVKMTWKR